MVMERIKLKIPYKINQNQNQVNFIRYSRKEKEQLAEKRVTC